MLHQLKGNYISSFYPVDFARRNLKRLVWLHLGCKHHVTNFAVSGDLPRCSPSSEI